MGKIPYVECALSLLKVKETCQTRYLPISPKNFMNDFYNNNYCPFRNARWIAGNANLSKMPEPLYVGGKKGGAVMPVFKVKKTLSVGFPREVVPGSGLFS